jgi:hypothetical protein
MLAKVYTTILINVKKAGTSRSKSESTISKKSYKSLLAGFKN